MTPHLSTLTLHQLRIGELAADARQAATSHLAGCERCRKRLAVQERTRDEFVLQPVPAALRPAPERPGLVSWVRSLVPLAAIAFAAATFVVVPAIRDQAPAEVEAARTKGGGASLEVWVDRDAGPRALRDDEPLVAGDRIQVLYDPEGAEQVALVGRDPGGAVEIWGTLSPDHDGLQPAPFALTLDATPGYQEVLVVRSPRPLTEDLVERAVAGDPPNGVTVESVLLPKR